MLPPALEDVASFIRDNRDGLHTDVGKLASITDILVRQQKALTETFDVAPLARRPDDSYNASTGRSTSAPSWPRGSTAALDPQTLLCDLLSGNPLGGVIGA